MKKLNWLKTAGAVCALLTVAVVGSPAQTFTTLYSFCAQFGCPDGYNPEAGLIQGTAGNFYGTVQYGGASGGGTIFKITPRGTLTTLTSMSGNDGGNSDHGLLLGANTNFYGAAPSGGNHGGGTVYKLTASGTLAVVYSFCQKGGCTDGDSPRCVLVQGSDGNFYGTTSSGGVDGYGTVFKVTPAGTLTTLHFFVYTDGASPYAGLVQATNGNFYGTTLGGFNDSGTVFEITPEGTLTTLHSFTGGTDGAFPQDALIQGTDGNLYGTAPNGGAHGGGTVFEITPEGTLSTLYSFCAQSGCADGFYPIGGVIQGTDGNFYGTTQLGGGDNCPSGCGVVFEVTPEGTETVLHTFVHTDGTAPVAPLVQGTNGVFYGTASGGGANDEGSIFSLDVGLGPFVETAPAFGRVAQRVVILGTDLTGATSVTFNGTSATFTVQSASAIETTVPAGATTGPVQVTLPSGTLTSNLNFQVLP
jgi:uncharacterized repeat protein (TIGR03803 family)